MEHHHKFHALTPRHPIPALVIGLREILISIHHRIDIHLDAAVHTEPHALGHNVMHSLSTDRDMDSGSILSDVLNSAVHVAIHCLDILDSDSLNPLCVALQQLFGQQLQFKFMNFKAFSH